MHFCKLNIKASGFIVSDGFNRFPHYKEANNRHSWHGQVGPQGHGWHDLCMGPQDIAIY